ncbi:MAG: Asp-tRNA(Asn)/Glu-tRNA(Gln) amidotransferase subunit GatA [Sediminibacterium sp. Gen4]|uniref:Asp-tRNA(Asn)/Glu-tRNA(Gln) amidotransferase subunit GatA n=1 Tax=unclassified Sediminibacterium TaxID=2635961 RepID=UPI0015C114AF|nr:MULTISPECIES: Asp-tRNA(Asn)/Glu-tRNA(Gln) amidotransferase subunit GatA [unclassified Sediminibacterium]MBW0160795.1 Asp-tRNA(Asn)/Glu-tRNA(Gln) amidotransferase subunit GatA [Sediminibacterium sp.]MBW0165612.1 Asp-tRNA(Asn)/Glu-tRNA(Gln) amidotransferase subunit GatA [Sediminibacterium sp.]NWK64943.1 Asp-tRNA(Asn)/Glu-tRNA(Gln) amidotransferase subunit GatA [Sediminibacterium sp. Gen4]
MFRFSTIKDYHTALQNGQTTCVEAVRFYIDRIQADQHLNAWLEVYAEEALAAAASMDKERSSNQSLLPLHGVVIGLKDVICYKDHRVSASSRMLDGFVSVYNATATQKLLDAGAIIIGRQNCDEFAMGSSNEHSAYGPVKNALDETRVPGGSSGGSAVAVQADHCMISLGSDTGGSVRQPADFCGIIGLKPGYGRISRYGLIAYASSFDQIGIFGKNIEDVALTLQIISGADAFDSTVSQLPVPDYTTALDHMDAPPKRIAYFKEALDHPGLDPAIKAATEGFIKKLTAQGYIVEPVDFELLEYVVPTYYVLTTAEASSNLSRYDGVRFGHRSAQPTHDLTDFYKLSRSEGFGKEVKRRIMLGSFVLSAGYYDAYFTKAQQVRRKLQVLTTTVFSSYDAIISPTVPAPAYRIGELQNDQLAMFLGDIYTVFANLVGIPAISIPLFQHPNGMPFGLQIMTSQNDEVSLLRLSKQFLELSE